MFHHHRVAAVVEQELEPGIQFARIVRMLANSHGNPRLAQQYATSIDDHVTAKALAAGSGTAGGFTVPEHVGQSVIEALRPRVAVRKLQPIIIPYQGGRFNWPRVTGGSTATYLGENTNAPLTQPEFGRLSLTTRKLLAVCVLSNDLFRFAAPAADLVITAELTAAIAAAEDAAFLRADGTASAPKGLRHWAPAANVFTAGTPVNFDQIANDLSRLELALTNGNTPMIRPGWIMAPRTEQHLKSLQNAGGSRAFPELIRDRKLNGYPVSSTTAIPTNLGAGGDETEIILADFSEVVLGEVPELVVAVSDDAAYFDGATVVSAYSQDQTVISVLSQHDLGMKHAEAVAVLTGVRWGV
jgi:HK97 family phage major capsid protein